MRILCYCVAQPDLPSFMVSSCDIVPVLEVVSMQRASLQSQPLSLDSLGCANVDHPGLSIGGEADT